MTFGEPLVTLYASGIKGGTTYRSTALLRIFFKVVCRKNEFVGFSPWRR